MSGTLKVGGVPLATHTGTDGTGNPVLDTAVFPAGHVLQVLVKPYLLSQGCSWTSWKSVSSENDDTHTTDINNGHYQAITIASGNKVLVSLVLGKPYADAAVVMFVGVSRKCPAVNSGDYDTTGAPTSGILSVVQDQSAYHAHSHGAGVWLDSPGASSDGEPHVVTYRAMNIIDSGSSPYYHIGTTDSPNTLTLMEIQA